MSTEQKIVSSEADYHEQLNQFDATVAQLRSAIKSGKRRWSLGVSKDSDGNSLYAMKIEAAPEAKPADEKPAEPAVAPVVHDGT